MAKKKSTVATQKRKLDEIIAELPTKEELSQRLQPLLPISQPPRLQLPNSLDLESPYAIFTLFISEEIFEFISQSTNQYAQQKIVEDSTTGRSWKETTAAEIKVFFGILIYMGVHKSPRIDSYWCQNRQEGPLHSPPLYMTLTRFEQVKRYLHISRPNKEQDDFKQWWYKVEPLASSFDKASQQYYQPGSNISIDETMIRCFGRTKHTVKMPSKPIEQGYKIFVLAEHGYIWTFTWTSRLWGIADLFKYDSLSPTASMVLKMIKKLPGLSDSMANLPANTIANLPAKAPYVVYMDNYFTSVTLFKELRELRCGACGTTRPQKGIPSQLVELKDHIKTIPWGTLYASEAQGILCLAWQDNNIVLLLSSIHLPELFTPTKRKRPSATSTNAAITRTPFGDEAIKELLIPTAIDNYTTIWVG